MVPTVTSDAGSEPAPGTARPRVAVVVVTYFSEDVIAPCLRALTAAAQGVELVCVVVADNDSGDSTVAAALAAYPGCTVLPTGGNLGYAAAINVATSVLPEHDVLVILNPDTRLEPHSLERLAQALREPSVGVAVPLLLTESGQRSRSLRRWPTLRTAIAESLLGGSAADRLGWGETVPLPPSGQAVDVDWATGAALAVDPEVARRLGPWDESFFLYSEETEYMQRAWSHGFRVRFVPTAVCTHRGGDSRVAPRLWALVLTNKVRLYGCDHGRGATATFRGVLLLGQLLRALLGQKKARAAAWALGTMTTSERSGSR